MRSFLRTLVGCSEKAACLARACRNEKDLFQLLVEEKLGDQKNTNFAHDFKTLADVLIQETVRHDLGERYPNLAEHILGEESNEFTNTLGEKIKVQVCATKDETSKLLSQVLDGHQAAADLLAREVHSEIIGSDQELLEQVPDDTFDVENLGIWIDPIDGTNNYIRGNCPTDVDADFTETFQTRGLPVVTVLIGVFDRTTGKPVAGVVNQPFVKYNHAKKEWKGRVHWGIISTSNEHFSSVKNVPITPEAPTVVISTNDIAVLEQPLLSKGYKVLKAGGAGYKILCVILGFADLYATTRPSTFKWDSCAGHAILGSLGQGEGGCVELQAPNVSLTYQSDKSDAPGITKFCNDLGLVAYRTKEDLNRFLSVYNQIKS